MNAQPDGEELVQALVQRIDAAVGAQLRAFREDRNITERNAAARAGVSQATWSRIERGEVSPRLSWLLLTQGLLGFDSIEGLLGPFPSKRIGEGDDAFFDEGLTAR